MGDACIELAVSEYLFKNLDLPEGDLTNIRSLLVNREKLSDIGAKLNLSNLIFMSKGQSKNSGKALDILISNAFEAITGAVFIQNGYQKAKKFVIDNVIKENLNKILDSKLFKDTKTYFQEKSQEIYKVTPEYKTLNSWGPDHEKKFEVGVFIKEELIASEVGDSKQEAERKAAFKALRLKKWLQNN